MKKFLSVLLTALFIILVLSLSACTAKETDGEKLISQFYDAQGVQYSVYKVQKQGESYNYAKVNSYNNVNNASIIKLVIPNKVTDNGVDYEVTTIGKMAFYKCNIDIIELSEGIKHIEPFAFAYSNRLQSVTAPSTVENIDDYAFINSKMFRLFTINGSTPPKLGAYAFKFFDEKEKIYKINSILTIKVPSKKAVVYNADSAWKEYKSIILE